MKKKLFITLCLGIAFQLVNFSAHAALNLTLTQGLSGAMPIAIVPFGSDTHQISAIVNTDLNNSGKFKVLDDSKLPASPTDARQINDAQWQNLKENNVVVGTVTSTGGQYHIHFQLVDIYKNNAVLLDQTITVPENELRQASHHVSDLIYQALTGVRGIFSTRLAYVAVQRPASASSTYSLIVSDYDGYNAKPILISHQPLMSPAWSHDGRKLAYVSFENQRPQIFISDVATGSRKLLTSFQGVNGAPAWSANDTEIAMALSKTGVTKIYELQLGTQSLTQLTTGNAIDTEPSFAPNGQSLLFTSDRGGSPQIYKVMLGNHQINRITFNGSYNARASYSPDGSSIVMIHAGSDVNGYGIGLQDLQTGSYIILDNSGDDQSPSFAPNGQMVVFSSKNGTQRQLDIVSTDGKIKLRLPSDEGSVQEPVWSPF